jgi:hypothetical protein
MLGIKRDNDALVSVGWLRRFVVRSHALERVASEYAELLGCGTVSAGG